MVTIKATETLTVIGGLRTNVTCHTRFGFQCIDIDCIQPGLNIFKINCHFVPTYYGPEQPEQAAWQPPLHRAVQPPVHLLEQLPEHEPEQPEQPEHPVEHPPVHEPVQVDVQVPEQLVHDDEQPFEHDQLHVPPQSS